MKHYNMDDVNKLRLESMFADRCCAAWVDTKTSREFLVGVGDIVLTKHAFLRFWLWQSTSGKIFLHGMGEDHVMFDDIRELNPQTFSENNALSNRWPEMTHRVSDIISRRFYELSSIRKREIYLDILHERSPQD